ncbi:hypothetical protein E2558_01075 [Staphylococcus pragensis]|uniref:Lipoprotein n=1 Tax=Staphylococcus pragensis TaxID=1611836 RepID=A0A4Z1BTN9_9STAP|nr:hypothetical protein [Staphylococcus pragensis]RTX90676.1 hypothetical protein CD154_03700 [Staphylococcus carnosus]TGN28249.1 hypothetical protein E2558_01075 [Staphylococcus pragensis]GGG88956.1 hypothetical protein GCM10007342_09140 [Staphylococcus pragensis]
MKILKHRKTLMLLSCLILIIFVTACGKEDKASNELVGNTYKAIQDGKVEANFTFEKDGTLKMVLAQGQVNAGKEARAEYKVLKEDKKLYLITHQLPKHFFNKKGGFYSTAFERNEDTYFVHLIKFENDKIILQQLSSKEDNLHKIESEEEIKNLKEDNNINYELEKISDN